MDLKLTNALEKFMDVFGITYYIQLAREGLDPSKGTHFACFRIIVKRGEKVEYYTIRCYELNDRGKIVFDSENITRGIKDGVLAFFIDTEQPYLYFDSKARQMAKEHFSHIV